MESALSVLCVDVHVCSSIRCPPGEECGGVHTVLVSLDEQPSNEGVLSQVCHQTVGLLLGEFHDPFLTIPNTHTPAFLHTITCLFGHLLSLQ